MLSKNSKFKILIICMALALFAGLVPSCASENGDAEASYTGPFDGKEAADLSGYDSMADYDGDIMLVETTVAEVDELMKNDESFVVFFSYANCPYCNRLMPYLNDAAAEAGVRVGYINTRSNPDWKSNMDIDGYDIVEDRFGKYLSKDEDGRLHLYTPDMYFIKNGKVVDRHDGVTEGADDPSDELTSDQEEKLMGDLKEEFDSIK